jgi:hypothetical protein
VLTAILTYCDLPWYFATGALNDRVAYFRHEGKPVRNAIVVHFIVTARQLIEFVTERNLEKGGDRDFGAGDFTREK